MLIVMLILWNSKLIKVQSWTYLSQCLSPPMAGLQSHTSEFVFMLSCFNILPWGSRDKLLHAKNENWANLQWLYGTLGLAQTLTN